MHVTTSRTVTGRPAERSATIGDRARPAAMNSAATPNAAARTAVTGGSTGELMSGTRYCLVDNSKPSPVVATPRTAAHHTGIRRRPR